MPQHIFHEWNLSREKWGDVYELTMCIYLTKCLKLWRRSLQKYVVLLAFYRWKEALAMQELWTVVLVLEESQNTFWPRWHMALLSSWWIPIWHGLSSALWESRPAGAGQALPGEGGRVLGRELQGRQPLLLWPSELWLCPRNIRCHMVSGGLCLGLRLEVSNCSNDWSSSGFWGTWLMSIWRLSSYDV